MVDVPNTTTRGQFLKSQGDGSNASVWSNPFQTWTVPVSGATLTLNASVTYTAITGLSQTVTGYSNYLVKLDATVGNNDTGGDHDVYLRIGYGLGSTTPTPQGNYMRSRIPAKAGTLVTYYYIGNTLVISTQPNQSVTIQAFGVIVGATSNGTVDRGILTIIGLP